MSKGLSQMSKGERDATVKRRLGQSEANRGLGYWAAVDSKERAKQEAKSGKRVDN